MIDYPLCTCYTQSSYLNHLGYCHADVCQDSNGEYYEKEILLKIGSWQQRALHCGLASVDTDDVWFYREVTQALVWKCNNKLLWHSDSHGA